MVTLLHEKESEQILGRVFEVRNELGGGWLEEVYHQALYRNLLDHNIPVVSKPQRQVIHRGVEVCTFIPDLIAWNKIILELKVLPGYRKNEFPSMNEGQLIHYLKSFNKDLGLLINFAHSKVGIKRLVLEPPKMEVLEDYERIKPHITSKFRDQLMAIRQCILDIGQAYGTGYSETAYRKILAIEFEARGMQCAHDVHVPAFWKNESLSSQQIQHLLVDNQFLLLVRATLEKPTTFDYIKTRTFMKALGLRIGLVINFGRNELQIIGTAVE